MLPFSPPRIDQKIIDAVQKGIGDLEMHTKIDESNVELPKLSSVYNDIIITDTVHPIKAIATALKYSKAEARATSAGAAIKEAFEAVVSMDAAALVGAVAKYDSNHNMHALNVLEHTSESDELREIMFAAMEGLPFDSAVVRNLDALKRKFVGLVEGKSLRA